jgi:hydrogenase maturation protein HypF
VEDKKSANIKVTGVVQGIGFRPFIYRLARKYNLNGWVRNTSENVEIEVEGTEADLQNFRNEIETHSPPMAHIEKLGFSYHARQGYGDFRILPSLSQKGKYQLVSPDIATCADCLQEIFSPEDRRYHYAFTNCTNCGPRFTIIHDIPYDRSRTTMRNFRMCPQCQEEYDDPANRRFHAQPNACPVCGPQLELVAVGGHETIKTDVIRRAAELLKEGRIIAVKGLGGFQLACDATSSQAVNELRRRKNRPAKPLAVMLGTIEDIEEHCVISPEEKALLQSPECPIVLVKWRKGTSDIVPEVAFHLNYLGVMLPYTPFHHLLMRETGKPLVMTSGNLSEEPICKDNAEARVRLQGIADYFILHNRDIQARYDDSVYTVEDGMPRAVRRARGYAPHPITLPFKAKSVLACGAEEKNTFCLTRDEHAFLSQHIGDLENAETLQHFENTIDLYQKLFRIEPELIAHDMHPEYLSTKYALEIGRKKGLRLVPVQHHEAHITSCLVENKAGGPVIGVAFDGTGYGNDGAIWGGEFLVGDLKGFCRAGHLEYLPLPGGAAAIRKPYRMALSNIFTLLGDDSSLNGLPFDGISPNEIELIKKQIKQGINSPPTSSMGRLFDAVSALTGIRQKIDYEAQAAIELEMIANVAGSDTNGTYPFNIVERNGTNIVELGILWKAIVQDVLERVPVTVISYRFHQTAARIIVDMSNLLSAKTGIRKIALSGGVFQNRLLFRLATSALHQEGFEVLSHRLVPCNDGGIALGQAALANYREG